MTQRYTQLELQVMHIKALFGDVVTSGPKDEYCNGIRLDEGIREVVVHESTGTRIAIRILGKELSTK